MQKDLLFKNEKWFFEKYSPLECIDCFSVNTGFKQVVILVHNIKNQKTYDYIFHVQNFDKNITYLDDLKDTELSLIIDDDELKLYDYDRDLFYKIADGIDLRVRG